MKSDALLVLLGLSLFAFLACVRNQHTPSVLVADGTPQFVRTFDAQQPAMPARQWSGIAR